MKYPYILFDLDGTLIDTNELILTSFMYALDSKHPGKFKREQVQAIMGRPLREMLAQFDETTADEMVVLYREHNLLNHDRLVKSFPNVNQVIEELYNRGHKMALVTTKKRDAAIKGLQVFGLDKWIPHAVCLDDTNKHKPDPKPLLMAMEKIAAVGERTIMVGDNPVDINGAKNAGVASCAVEWSMRSLAELQAHQPDYIISDMKNLLDIV